VKHIDEFNLHNWRKQALGIKGYLKGNSTFFMKKLQPNTNLLLNKFEKNKPIKKYSVVSK
jgi:hypothetical protein